MLRPIDPKRVYLTGMSNGGFMVERLACARPDLIAGAAIVAATLRKSQSTACGSAPVVPMAIMLGSRDSRINLEANIGLGLLTGQQAFDRYVALGGCDRWEEHTSELQSLMRNSYADLCLK